MSRIADLGILSHLVAFTMEVGHDLIIVFMSRDVSRTLPI